MFATKFSVLYNDILRAPCGSLSRAIIPPPPIHGALGKQPFRRPVFFAQFSLLWVIWPQSFLCRCPHHFSTQLTLWPECGGSRFLRSVGVDVRLHDAVHPQQNMFHRRLQNKMSWLLDTLLSSSYFSSERRQEAPPSPLRPARILDATSPWHLKIFVMVCRILPSYYITAGNAWSIRNYGKNLIFLPFLMPFISWFSFSVSSVILLPIHSICPSYNRSFPHITKRIDSGSNASVCMCPVWIWARTSSLMKVFTVFLSPSNQIPGHP